MLRIFLPIVLLPFNNNTSAIYVPDRSRCIFIKIQNCNIYRVIDCQMGKLTQRYSVFCYIHSKKDRQYNKNIRKIREKFKQ